jgi:hypothetical protein
MKNKALGPNLRFFGGARHCIFSLCLFKEKAEQGLASTQRTPPSSRHIGAHGHHSCSCVTWQELPKHNTHEHHYWCIPHFFTSYRLQKKCICSMTAHSSTVIDFMLLASLTADFLTRIRKQSRNSRANAKTLHRIFSRSEDNSTY